MSEQPEQWAEELYVQVHNLVGVEAIALIQRAFAEREAELVAALEEIKGVTERRQLPLTYQINELATAALKSREADRG